VADRVGARGLHEHRPDTHASHLREARRPLAQRGRRSPARAPAGGTWQRAAGGQCVGDVDQPLGGLLTRHTFALLELGHSSSRTARIWNARTIVVMPCIRAQIPANTRSTYALWMKNWPEVQKASAVIRIPEISPIHQSGLIARSRKARTIHQMPMIRNRKPSVSAR